MPLYEFTCQSCEKRFELLVSGTRRKGAKCPHCGSTKLEKTFSTFASKVASGKSTAAAPTACGRSGGCCCGGGHHHH